MRILVTSALPYINGVKHLGNLVGSMLPADVYARFQRARGHEVLFICATDEHGTPAELAALEAGQSVADYCRQQHAIQKDVGERFGLSWDFFGRSSSEQNKKLTQDFARALWKNGHLEVRATRQVYSRTEGRFLPDRYVIGTCPHCGYERARGDQCENCTRVLDPTDLISPRSAVSGSPDIEIRESKHLFLKQSAFAGRLRAWIESKRGEWPQLVTSIAFKWLDEGLHDRGITRDLAWGVPVPDDIADGQLKGKVFYVWFDAPIEYIGATWEWADAHKKGDAWRDWWTERKENDPAYVRYVEFMAKDNVPFHTVGFPVTIFGVNENLPEGKKWKIVDQLKGFNWLTYYGGKFSTSGRRGVFMDSALELLPADYWRYYLIANAPESADASFTWEHFAAVVNKDLADVLGNFVNRVTKFCASRFDGKVPAGAPSDELDHGLIAQLWLSSDQLTVCLEQMEYRAAMKALRAILVSANEYVTELAPWTLYKTDQQSAGRVINVGLNLCHLIARFVRPFIPRTSDHIFRILNMPIDETWPVTGEVKKTPSSRGTALSISGWGDNRGREFELVKPLLSVLPPDHRLNPPDLLFPKIEDEQVKAWERRFSGAG
ncbi:MAG: methionine--tRNA ligase [Alphaproteobacteria bacterium]